MIPALIALSQVTRDEPVIDQIRARGLTDLGAYSLLKDLCTKVGGRVSGTPEAAKAVRWVEGHLKEIGAVNVREVACMVPHWQRGKPESCEMTPGGRLAVTALGGSVGTPKSGIEAEVVEVASVDEAALLGAKGKGKIVFINQGFDPRLASTFEAYGGAVGARYGGASAAAKSGAVAVLVRSMTLAHDDAPHTGAMGYSGTEKIPAAALGILSAEKLSAALKKGPVRVKLTLTCQTLPDAPSANVLGEIVGSEKPDEVICMGGHLDSWDTGQGAHDDGAGVVQAMEALRLFNVLGLKPKRTVRVVAWMNEENGGRGAEAYLEYAKTAKEKHYAAIESDSGGFMPRMFGASKEHLERARAWEPAFRQFGIERFVEGGADADNGPLAEVGASLFSLIPENQRYFDVHHSKNDNISNVHPRELEMGACAIASLVWLLSEEGP